MFPGDSNGRTLIVIKGSGGNKEKRRREVVGGGQWKWKDACMDGWMNGKDVEKIDIIEWNASRVKASQYALRKNKGGECRWEIRMAVLVCVCVYERARERGCSDAMSKAERGRPVFWDK